MSCTQTSNFLNKIVQNRCRDNAHAFSYISNLHCAILETKLIIGWYTIVSEYQSQNLSTQ
jgi:hypothetical protein